MFNRSENRKKSKVSKPKMQIPKLYPVHSHGELFKHEQQKIMTEIKTLINAPATNYQLYCEKLIFNTGEYLQRLPEQNKGNYAYHGGMLDFALDRTSASLKQLKEYFNSNIAPNSILKNRELWTYTLFSAALLRNIGRLETDFSILLLDDKRKIMRQWSPYDGSMYQTGASYYKFEFKSKTLSLTRTQTTILLARQIMPDIGFKWIRENETVFNYWLNTLTGQDEGKGRETSGRGPKLRMTDIVNRILNKLTPGQNNATNFFTPPEATENLNEENAKTQQEERVDDKKDADSDPKAKEGQEFIEWLTEQLANNSILNNNPYAFIHSVGEGALVTNDIFRQFAKQFPLGREQSIGARVLRIINSLNHMGLLQQNPNGNATMARYENTQTKAILTGVVIKNPGYHIGLKPAVVNQFVKPTGEHFAQTTNKINQQSWPNTNDASSETKTTSPEPKSWIK